MFLAPLTKSYCTRSIGMRSRSHMLVSDILFVKGVWCVCSCLCLLSGFGVFRSVGESDSLRIRDQCFTGLGYDSKRGSCFVRLTYGQFESAI